MATSSLPTIHPGLLALPLKSRLITSKLIISPVESLRRSLEMNVPGQSLVLRFIIHILCHVWKACEWAMETSDYGGCCTQSYGTRCLVKMFGQIVSPWLARPTAPSVPAKRKSNDGFTLSPPTSI